MKWQKEAEDQLILRTDEKSCYHLGQVEATYFLVIAYDRHMEIDEPTRALFSDFRKNIRLNHLFKRLVKDWDFPPENAADILTETSWRKMT